MNLSLGVSFVQEAFASLLHEISLDLSGDSTYASLSRTSDIPMEAISNSERPN